MKHPKKDQTEYDAVIIGTGQGGVPLAQALANAGWKTAVIERSYAGGTCINYGCTPTKTMVASAKAADLVKRASVYGVDVSSFKVKMNDVRKRKKQIVGSFREGINKRLKGKDNITFFEGRASFENKTTIAIEKSKEKILINGKKIFINTGCRPSVPDIEGLKNISFLDSTTIMELKEIPKHLIIIGGGYIGLEFGQMFRRFGSKVTIIQHGNQLLAREDKDIADEVYKIISEDGIKILLNEEVIKVEKTKSGKIKAGLKNSKNKFISGTHLLAAAGRTPNTDSLNLSAAGVELDKKGFVKVNDKLETSVEDIYAIGDVKGGPAFTHISYDDFRILKKNILERENATIKGRQIPYVVFTDPQLGRVGLSEKEAAEKGFDFAVAKLPMDYIARAIETGETKGLMKVIIDKKSDEIIGCAILGMEGGEIMAMLQIAMMAKLNYKVLREGIFAHPTLAESLNSLFMKIE